MRWPWVSALGNLWTLPNTVLGFFIGLCLAWSLPRLDRKRGYFKFDRGGGISGWMRRCASATTFGHAVVFWEPSTSRDEAILEHELVHVRQYDVLGLFYLPLYLALLPFYGGQRRHPLERPAYARQDEVQASRPT
ncbi:MAG: DUF4157 domain-containing protein [Chloroflexota bacterium]|nr:DUF4157 domain-containing protein [Chloroflexota bacterium]